jgi:DNA (cytosine-5)-methyltransferase 1
MPKIIDLYAGAGGLSLGAARAGFDVAAAVEIDKYALETHKKNFPNTAHIDLDVGTLSGSKLIELAGLKQGELTGLIGGPPCQGFSTMGQGNIEDIRNDLFGHFFRLVTETSPAFFVAENVPNIMNPKYDEIRKAAFARLDPKYRMLAPIKVKASDYGAPTIRTRMFFIGFDPAKIDDLDESLFAPGADIESVVVRKALEGLPIEIDPNWISEASGWRPIERMSESHYAHSVTNNVPSGIGDMLTIDRYFEKNEVSGCMGTRHTKDVEERYRALEFGKQDRISKAIKLNPEGFCPTLRAGTGSDKGSYQAVRPIHYVNPRVITPREAARLQGFPDWFALHNTKWHSFRQIGNSVSPIVSEKLLSTIRERCKL